MDEHPTLFEKFPFYQEVEAAIEPLGFCPQFLANFLGGSNEAGKTCMGFPVSAQHIYGALLVGSLLLLASIVFRMRSARSIEEVVPSDRFSLAMMVELILETIHGTMVDMMGEKRARMFLPLIGTAAFFILASNLLGLFPGLTPPTDNFRTTLALGLVVFLATHIYGFAEHGVKYFPMAVGLTHFTPKALGIKEWSIGAAAFAGCMMLLGHAIAVIEMFSHALRPLTLGVRLGANMTADHMLAGSILGINIDVLGPLVPLFSVPIYMMGTLVSVVQTAVFCLLSMVYFTLATEHEEH